MVERFTASAGRQLVGVVLVVVASFAFGTSGAFAKSLLHAGWSPGGVVTWRVVLAAVVMVPVAAYAVRGQWSLVRRNWVQILVFGLVAVAGCQFAYFNAVERLSVAMALLLEYSGVVLVVFWAWLVRGQRPHQLTVAGMVLAVVGLLFVLQVFSGLHLSWLGVAWGLLAASGLATFYLMASHEHGESLPPIALAGFGLGVGAVVLIGCAGLGLIDYTTAREAVSIGGFLAPWWVPVAELSLVAAALAYGVGVVGTRMAGATVASFVGLTEVLFAILIAWLVLGELPTWGQLGGAVLVLAGVVAVRIGEARVVSGEPVVVELPVGPTEESGRHTVPIS